MNPGPEGLAGLSAPEVAEALGLQPHLEGGYFRETYRAAVEVDTAAGPRPLSTAVLFLLASDSPSRFHRLASDELWLYHAGARAELWLLPPKAEGTVEARVRASRGEAGPMRRALTLSPDRPCAVVPARWWMGARVTSADGPEETGWTLVSCVVTPGFEYEDFELGDRETLLRYYPAAGDVILALT